MILAYLEANKLLCAVWIGTKPADSALNSALFAICSVTATIICNTGKYENLDTDLDTLLHQRELFIS